MCNHLTNFAILMDVIDDTAQFIEQIGLFDENMRILISISIAISIVFIVIALLTLKFFNGIFIKVRTTTQPSGQDTLNSLNSCNIQLSTNNCFENNPRQCYNGDNTGGIGEMPTCQSGARSYNEQVSPNSNILQMPNNDCTISAVNNLSERIPLQNYQHFHHHYHHHHHFHLQQPAHGQDNTHNHFVFNSNVFNANTTNLSNSPNCLQLTSGGGGARDGCGDERNNGSPDDRNLIVNLRKNDTIKNDVAMDRVTTAYGTTNEMFPMARLTHENSFISRGHLQGHLHSHYS